MTHPWSQQVKETVLQIYLGNDYSLSEVDSGIKHLSMCLELLPRYKEQVCRTSWSPW